MDLPSFLPETPVKRCQEANSIDVESLIRNRTLARGVYRVNNPDLSSPKGISGDPRER
jgi:hypothetical protein